MTSLSTSFKYSFKSSLKDSNVLLPSGPTPPAAFISSAFSFVLVIYPSSLPLLILVLKSSAEVSDDNSSFIPSLSISSHSGVSPLNVFEIAARKSS